MNKKQIINSLKRTERLFQNNIGNIQGKYYAKLTIIEACGWLEESMDSIILECGRQHIQNPDILSTLQRSVDDNSSFKYEPNFKRLLENMFGLIALDRLERAYNDSNDTRLYNLFLNKIYLGLPQSLDDICNYDTSSKNVIKNIFGKFGVGVLENAINQGKFVIMESALARLKQSRDSQAHTSINGTAQPRIDSPTLTIGLFNDAYIGLKDIEVIVRRLTKI